MSYLSDMITCDLCQCFIWFSSKILDFETAVEELSADTLHFPTPLVSPISGVKQRTVCPSLQKAQGCVQLLSSQMRKHMSLWFCVHTNVLLCVPCWSRWWLHPLCHKAAPGCARHCARVQRRSTCWCRTSPSPRSPSPPCTPSSGYLWAPDGNSVER